MFLAEPLRPRRLDRDGISSARLHLARRFHSSALTVGVWKPDSRALRAPQPSPIEVSRCSSNVPARSRLWCWCSARQGQPPIHLRASSNASSNCEGLRHARSDGRDRRERQGHACPWMGRARPRHGPAGGCRYDLLHGLDGQGVHDRGARDVGRRRKIKWDDKVIDHMPDFRMWDPWVTREMTIRDLLVHRSGLGLGEGDLLFVPNSNLSRKETTRRIRYLKPATSFRSGYAYDNILYMAAGQLIEEVSGETWEQYVAPACAGAARHEPLDRVVRGIRCQPEPRASVHPHRRPDSRSRRSNAAR